MKAAMTAQATRNETAKPTVSSIISEALISIRHGAASFAVLCGGLRLDPLCHLLDNHRHCRAGTG